MIDRMTEAEDNARARHFKSLLEQAEELGLVVGNATPDNYHGLEGRIRRKLTDLGRETPFLDTKGTDQSSSSPAERLGRVFSDVRTETVTSIDKAEMFGGAEPSDGVGTAEIVRYVDKAMFRSEEFSEESRSVPSVILLQGTADPLGAVAAMSMMYEGRVVRDLTTISDDERRHYFDECFKTTLKAPLEAIDLHLMVEGVTRSHTHQEVRQRTAVFAQESMRFAVKENLRESVRPQPSIRGNRDRLKRYYEAIDKINEVYLWMIADGVPAEDARGLLPHDTLTRLHHKVNLRNLADEIGKRLCTQAQFEWRAWAGSLRQQIMAYNSTYGVRPVARRGLVPRYYSANWQWQYIADSPIFQPICFSTGQCMFKAAMDRGCTIRERVDAGRFDEIETAEWASDPTAAWVR